MLLLLRVCFFFVVGGGFVGSLSRGSRAGVVEAFNSASGYLGGLLDIDNVCFDRVVGRMCPAGLQLGGANSSDAGAPFLGLSLCVSSGTVSARIYDRRDDFDFDIVNFPFLDGDVPRRASCGVCMSRLVRFAGASSGLNDFDYRNGTLAAGLLGRGCRCFWLRRAFSGLCRGRGAMFGRYGVGLGALLREGVSEPEFCGDLVCGFRSCR